MEESIGIHQIQGNNDIQVFDVIHRRLAGQPFQHCMVASLYIQAPSLERPVQYYIAVRRVNSKLIWFEQLTDAFGLSIQPHSFGKLSPRSKQGHRTKLSASLSAIARAAIYWNADASSPQRFGIWDHIA